MAEGIKHAYKYHTAASGFYLVKNEQILALALLQLATESKQNRTLLVKVNFCDHEQEQARQ